MQEMCHLWSNGELNTANNHVRKRGEEHFTECGILVAQVTIDIDRGEVEPQPNQQRPVWCKTATVCWGY